MDFSYPLLVLHAARATRGGWSADPLVLVPLLLVAIIYVRGLGRLRAARGRGAMYPRAIAFLAGLLVLAAGLQTPLEGYAERSLSMHMVQHILLTSVAAPLILLGRPAQVLTLGLPASVRALGGRAGIGAAARWAGGRAGTPVVAGGVFVSVYLGWHIPALYEAAIEHEPLHVLEHVSFITAALIFWYPVIQGRRRGWRSPPARIAYLGFAMLVTSALAVALMVSNTVWYPIYEGAEPLLDLTPLEDQRLAGAIMWVFDGLIYAGVAAAVFLRWLDLVSREAAVP